MARGLEDWPGRAWAEALDALSRSWRAGTLPGVLFNGTRAARVPSILRHGFRASEGDAADEDGDVLFHAVHLGTPEIAAWYMHDTATGSGAVPALVAVDVAGWEAACLAAGKPPPRFLADRNSAEYPALSALGARHRADVLARLGSDAPGWRASLAVAGAVAVDVDEVPPAFLRALRTPHQVEAFARDGWERPAAGGSLSAGIDEARGGQPWAAGGWRFSAAALGRRPVPAEELDDGEHLAEFGIGRAPR